MQNIVSVKTALQYATNSMNKLPLLYHCLQLMQIAGSTMGLVKLLGEQGYIFFKRPVFYSPDGQSLRRKFLLLKATQPPQINVLLHF